MWLVVSVVLVLVGLAFGLGAQAFALLIFVPFICAIASVVGEHIEQKNKDRTAQSISEELRPK
jgi:hypothetical protein